MQTTIQNVLSQFKIFENMNTLEIGKEIGLNTNLLSKKLSVATLSNQMFKHFNIDLPKLKHDFNIAVKTVRLKENGVPKESMSFEQIKFHEIVKENWDSSFIKNKFMQTTFLFVAFEYLGEELYFKGIKIWKMPDFIINEDLKSFWLSLKTKLENGVILKSVKKANKSITENNLPSSKQSNIMHVRPKAKNANDKVELPDGQFITKQSYWFNNDFVSSILSDMPSLQVTSATLTRTSELNNYDYSKIKPLLSNEIYTITKFIQIAQQVFSNFNDFNVNKDHLHNIGYQLAPPFILRNEFKTIDGYFNQKILKNRYFIRDEDDDVWQSSFVNRKLDNMENEYSIFKIDEGIYLTETALKFSAIEKTEVISYRECVEAFVEKEQYFTYHSLKKNFQHPVDGYGFEQLFYESLLKRPGRLKSVKVCGHLFFIKTTSKKNLSHFFKSILIEQKKPHLSVYDLVEVIEYTYYVKLSFEALDTLLDSNNLNLYYSKKLERIFYSKNDYLNFIQ